MRALSRFFLGVLILYAAFCATLFVTQRNHIYHPNEEFPSIPERAGAGFVRVASDDGLTLIGWHAPAQDNKKTILYFHGNAGHIGHRWRMVEPYVEAGYGVLLASYRGYGGNEGRPSEQGFYHDARAYLNFLTGERDVPLPRIVVYGESIGSGPAVQIASENPDLAGLVLITPFSSVADIARDKFFYVPVDLFLLDRFDNIAKVGALAMPQYYFAAGADEIVPPASTRALYEAASEPKFWHEFPNLGHNRINHPALIEAVTDVLAAMEENR